MFYYIFIRSTFDCTLGSSQRTSSGARVEHHIGDACHFALRRYAAQFQSFITECSILVTSSPITEILRDSVFLVPRNYVAQPLAFLASPPKCPDTGDEDFCREGELDFVCEM